VTGFFLRFALDDDDVETRVGGRRRSVTARRAGADDDQIAVVCTHWYLFPDGTGKLFPPESVVRERTGDCP
jgi:hypothetical protein